MRQRVLQEQNLLVAMDSEIGPGRCSTMVPTTVLIRRDRARALVLRMQAEVTVLSPLPSTAHASTHPLRVLIIEQCPLSSGLASSMEVKGVVDIPGLDCTVVSATSAAIGDALFSADGERQYFDVIHFLGHGVPDGMVADNQNRHALIDTEAFADVLSLAPPALIFLNACKQRGQVGKRLQRLADVICAQHLFFAY